MSTKNIRKPLIATIIIITFLLLLHFMTKPPDNVLQEARKLRVGAEKSKQRFQWAVTVAENGIDYILENSDLNEREAREVFFLCLEKSQKYDIPLNLLLNVIRVESNFNQVAISHKGALGIMQILPKTAKSLCKEMNLSYHRNKLYDMEFNMELGSYFLSKLFKRYGNWEESLAHYNSGRAKNLAYLKLIRKK